MHAAQLPLLSEGSKKKWSYSSLIFSLSYFVPLFYAESVAPRELMIFGCGYILFVALYLLAIHCKLSTLPLPLSALTALSFTISFYNPGASVLFGFIAYIAGYYYPVSAGIAFVLFTGLSLTGLQLFWFDDHLLFFLASLINLLVLFCFGVMERKETRSQLKDARHAESLSALSAIAERERIGRDLHDIAGHALSSMSLKAQLAGKLIEKGRTQEAHGEVKALAHLSQSLLSEIRHAVSDLKKLSVSEEITKNTRALSELGFAVNASVNDDALSGLSALQESHLALVVKEVFTNILRHSKGNLVSLSALRENGMLAITIEDNGKHAVIDAGNGLTGIRERAGLIGAEMSITSGDATRVRLTLHTGE